MAEDSQDGLFQSGEWRGFYTDPSNGSHGSKRHMQDLRIDFINGEISGTGIDDLCRFSIRGGYDNENGKCRWTKRYDSQRSPATGEDTSEPVEYIGFNEGKYIFGTWEIKRHYFIRRGGFKIWPKGSPEGDILITEEKIHYDEPILIGRPPVYPPIA